MTTPDLRAVDELCRLAVAARRLGCTVHLAGAGPELRGLLQLAGVDMILPDCPMAGPAVWPAPAPATE